MRAKSEDLASVPLTPQQRRLLNIIRDFIDKHGFSPSRAELAKAMHLSSTNAIAGHLYYLRRKGFVAFTPGVARSLSLTPKGQRS